MLDSEKEQKKIGNKLKQLRIKKGYKSAEDFAYEFELSRVQYWRMESGTTNVTVKSLVKVLNIHKLTLEDFFNL